MTQETTHVPQGLEFGVDQDGDPLKAKGEDATASRCGCRKIAPYRNT